MSTLGKMLRLPEGRSAGLMEQRNPKGATIVTRYQTPGMVQVEDWDAEAAIRYGFYANVFVYRCVQIIAETIAAIPFRAGASLDKQANYRPNARLAQLLGPPPITPNPETTADDLWANSVAQYLVTGRFGWEIETAPGRDEIIALWPLASSQLRAVPNTSRGNNYFAGFEYGPPERAIKYTEDQVFYNWRPSLHDYRQAESVLRAAHLDISVAVMQDRYDYAFLKNDARPAAVVVTQEFADRAEFDAFKSEFTGEYGGPDNAGKAAFVEMSTDDGNVAGSIDIKTLGLGQKDAEFIKRYEQKIKGICAAIGVPLSKIDASGRTFDNAEEEDRTWHKTTILPLLRRLQNRVNLKLAPRLGNEVGWFDLSGIAVLQEPKRFVQISSADAVRAGLVTPEEVRVFDLNLPAEPDEGMGELSTSAPSNESPAVAELITGPTVPAAVGEPDEDEENDEDRARRVETRVTEQQARRVKIWNKTNRQATRVEKQFQRAMAKLFAKQEKATLARLNGKRGAKALGTRAATDAVFERLFWEQETREEVDKLYELIAELGGGRVADAFGVDFDLEAPYVQDFIQARSNQLAGQVTKTTYGAIQDQMAEGVAAGEDIPTLGKRIQSVFDTAKKSRAVTIARTETISAYNGSAAQVASQLPYDVVAGQEWIATQDGRTRETHNSVDGQVRPIGVAFDVGGRQMAYPGDPSGGADEVVNCRCTVGYLTPADIAERSKHGELRLVKDVNRELREIALRSVA